MSSVGLIGVFSVAHAGDGCSVHYSSAEQPSPSFLPKGAGGTISPETKEKNRNPARRPRNERHISIPASMRRK